MYEQTLWQDHVTEFEDIPFVYSLEYLNQYILTNDSIYKSSDLYEIISHAVIHLMDGSMSDEPIYIVSFINNRVCSRFNITNGYHKIKSNSFLYMGKDKISKKTFIALLQQDVTMLNKSIYSKLKSEEIAEEES